MSKLQPVPAATVVLARAALLGDGIEILLMLRNSKLVFHGGHWVFPGGKIDAQDYEPDEPANEYKAALNAAVRETKEEACIDIEPQALIHTAHWTTPEHLPRRYSTWFFVCPIMSPVKVQVDNSEMLDHRWLSPANALEAASTGEIELPRPTLTTLRDIASYQSLAQLMQGAADTKIHIFPDPSPFYQPEAMGYLPR